MDIIFYKTSDGEEPVKEFILDLEPKMRARVYRSINLLSEFGHMLREPDSKSLGDGIFELRIQQGNDISRVLYFFYVGDKAVLTNGFIKKSQKTPTNVIERAKRYRSDFLNREENQK
ncbi:MAG: type II toxin-antitoxin system RelE/ParE family toxin [Oscillospiraceae bacterium]|nr:type II toxin-antitoxin system RelE/ParE family toxin [Oscillospiraceae bacterium]